MGLSVGTRLGPYEILSPLGAGGMGEVYLARDTRLDRSVAIKVLPSHLSSNADLKQRFEREAKAISALQHPHICTLFDVGTQDGIDFLVMEHLEGETLSERLKRGPLPLPQLLKMAIELAEALEKAHHAGLIHRDLKPGNIMLTKSGAKLLDFGLAKPVAMQAAASSGSGSSPLLSGALTQSSPAGALTSVGTVVGTVQYMSPEQIGGQEADVCSDIFAFGAVLYESASGKRAFEGKTSSAVVGAILAVDPPPASTFQPGVSGSFDRVVSTCLAKDPAERFESARDLKLQLEWVRDFGTTGLSSAKTLPSQKSIWMLGGAAAIAGMLVLWAALLLFAPRPSVKVVRAEISPPPGLTFDSIGDLAGVPVISPQGDKIAFVAKSANNPQTLWVRPMDSLSAQKLDGTEGASHPFWSPDGTAIGFFTTTKMHRIPAAGGPVTVLSDVTNPRGASWGKNGVIVYAPDFRSGLMQVSAKGGTPSPATVIDPQKHTTHRWPFFLPDGKHFLYYATNHGGGQAQDNGIYFGSIDGKVNRLVLATDSGGEYASGFLLFHSQTALMAQPFNPSNGEMSGTAVPIVNNVRYDSGVWRAVFSASSDGVLCFQPGTSSSSGTVLQWYDRSGKPIKTVGERANQADLALSPDGKRLALVEGDPFWELWVLDLERGGRTRLTFNEGTVKEPAWSPDGKSLVYSVSSSQGGGNRFDIRMKAANGSGAEQTLTPEKLLYTFPAYSPDGQYLTYISGRGQVAQTLWAMPLKGDHTPFMVITPPSPQTQMVHYKISPNGKWVAYTSDESGRNEIYVAPFPKGEGKWQVSTTGASYSLWRGDGKELYFKNFNDETFAAPITERGSELEPGTPQMLFKINEFGNGFPYDVSADGQRFLLNKSEEAGAAPLYVVVNWTADLKEK